MDDPQQFVGELVRVGKAGYIGSPSEIAERLFHWGFHRWYVNLVGETLVLHPKEPQEPFGELFDYLYEYNPAYHFFQRSMPELFWTELEWCSSISLQITDHSPLPLQNPEALRALVRPRLSPPAMLAHLAASLLARVLRSDSRKRLRRLLGRSYL
jgi:hypothetical protein